MRILFFLALFFTQAFAANEAAGEALDQKLSQHIHYSATGPNLVGHLYIGGHDTHISQGTYLYVKKALEAYKEIKPIFIILELDTPGGELFAAQKISDLLKEMDTQWDIPVIAFINNWAISAGALLAYSCRFITVVKDGSMGAAEPITQAGEKTSEKVNSAIRADFAARAAFYERNPLIAEAMVDQDLTLVLRERKILKLENADQIRADDWVITTKGKLLTLNAKEMLELGVADIRLLPEKLPPLTAEEKKEGKWPASKELLFSYPFFQKIPNAIVQAYKMDWKTRFFSILSSPFVTSLLFFGLLISFYIEFSAGSFGAFGIIGLICLFLLVLSSFAVQTSAYLEFILIGAGLVLILVEIFIFPGLWIAGSIGALLTITSLIILLLPGIENMHYDFNTHTLNAAGQYVIKRIAWLAGAVVVGVFTISLIARYLVPKVRKFSPFILRGEQEGYQAGIPKEEMPKIGSLGIVFSPLRTAGKVEIEGEIYDAVSSGSFIDKGENIKVIRVEGSRLVVEEVRE